MENNIKAYLSQLGIKMESDKARIIESLSSGSKTIEMLRLIGIHPTTLTARLSDLTDAGIVNKISTNSRFSIYALSNEKERQLIFKQREAKKKERWEKLGKKMGWLV